MCEESIDAKISRARALYGRFEEELRSDPAINSLFSQYRRNIEETSDTMARLELGRVCGRCALRPAGSCCFRGAEDWYDAYSLVINLRFGVRLPKARELEGKCLFVGERGCKLVARYAFCINYFCPELYSSVGQEQINDLRTKAGREIYAGWELERSLRKWFGNRDLRGL